MNSIFGSIWRRWDLHVHTPYSILNHGDLGNAFCDSKEAENTIIDKFVYELFNRAIDAKLSCIGITDYFTMEGYKSIQIILNDSERLNTIFQKELKIDSDYIDKIKSILLLPNIEFRLDKTISVKQENGEYKSSKIQIHVIFSNAISVTEIEDNFLHALSFNSDSSVLGFTTSKLTLNSIQNFGKQLNSTGIGGRGSDLEVGMNSIYVKLDEVKNLLSGSRFKNNAVIILAEEDQSYFKWDGQTGAIRKELYSISNAIFSPNSKTINWCKSKECLETIGKKLPCLWGSDAHTYEEIFNPANFRFCWIKADLTFEGLLQALDVFEARIYIGKFPTQLEDVNKRLAYTIKNIKIESNREILHKKWFDVNLFFNPDMITIIGNKGSGKSAISDIIGYLGNSHNLGNASFLTKNRFLDKKSNFGIEYNASMQFYNSSSNVIRKGILSDTFDYSSPELVKFLPQKYIEEVCNDISDKFQNEIDNAIFSYVPLQDKEGASSINDLIALKTKSITDRIKELKNSLSEANEKIELLENKSKSKYCDLIKNSLANQQLAYTNHVEQKPIVVTKPSEIESNNFSQTIVHLNTIIDDLDKQIFKQTEILTNVNIQLQLIDDFSNKVKYINEHINLANREYLELCRILMIDNSDYIIAKYDDNCLEAKKASLQNQKFEISKLINTSRIDLCVLDIPEIDMSQISIQDVSSYDSLFEKKFIIEEYVSQISKRISNQEQLYFKYESDIKKWEQKRLMILGEIENTVDGESVKKYKDELFYLSEKLSEDLNTTYTRRMNIISEIIDENFKRVASLESIYEPVQVKINSINGLENNNIVFNATIRVDKNKLKSDIINLIDQRIESKFRGLKEGYNFVDNLVESTNFNDRNSILTFVNNLYENTISNLDFVDVLLKNRKYFNDFVGSLSFLSSNFTIKSDGKLLSELSPGERGIVLLIFYLALSKGNSPLIIDQPEDNLDNQSVFTRLVPAIIEAKKNRQIIVVTHNPNIAIACDSEQIIYCKQNKDTKELEYLSGSIENLMIKRNIIDILEGTRPAFDLRKNTYEKS